MKKFLLGLFAVTFAIAFSAFTYAPETMTVQTFQYNGLGDVDDPASWDEVTESCGSGIDVLCTISFDDQTPNYGLDQDGKPNATVLTAIEANYLDQPTQHSFVDANITFVRKAD